VTSPDRSPAMVDVLTEALAGAEQMRLLLTFALEECLNTEIDEQERRNSTNLLRRKAYVLSVRLQHILSGVP